MISQDLKEFLDQKGLPISFGTRDQDLLPQVGRAAGVIVSPDRKQITAVVPDRFLGKHLDNLQDNQQIALTVTEIESHRSIQLKGKYVSHSDSLPEEIAVAEENSMKFAEILIGAYGEHLKAGMESPVDFYVSITFHVEEIFDQTPGPGAGNKVH